MTFYILHRHSLLCGFNLQLVQLVGRLWVFFLSHSAPGFQLWLYFHLHVGHPLGFAPGAVLEELGLPL